MPSLDVTNCLRNCEYDVTVVKTTLAIVFLVLGLFLVVMTTLVIVILVLGVFPKFCAVLKMASRYISRV